MHFYLRIFAFFLKSALLVLLIFAFTSLFNSPASPISSAPIDSIGMGSSTHLQVGVDNLDVAYQALEDMNIHWIREEIPWVEVEPIPNQFNWSYTSNGLYVDYDSMLALAERHHLQVVAVLSTGPAYLPHIYPDQPIDADELVQQWQNYVQAVVDRYGDRIDYWEIGDEMNNPAQWGKVMFPTVEGATANPSPFIYARMLATASKIIKKHNRQDTIILGGLYNSANSDCFTNPIGFLKEIYNAGAWKTFDVVALHPYWQNNPPETWMTRGPSYDLQTGLCQMDVPAESNLLGEVRAIKDFTAQLGAKPIWITELGWRADWLAQMGQAKGLADDQVQANMVLRSVIPLLSEPGVEKVFWYSTAENSANPGFILSPSASQVLKNIARLLGKARPLGQFQTYSDLGTPQELGLFEYRFRKEGRSMLFTWAAIGGDQPYQITLSNLPGTKYRAYAANSDDLSLKNGMRLEPDRKKSLTLYVSETPAILIEEKPGIVASLKFRIEDGTSRLIANLQKDSKNWIHLQLQQLSNDLLDWAENNIFDFLNWGVDTLSGN